MNSLRSTLYLSWKVLRILIETALPIALIVFGAYVRFQGMSLSDLWEDELWRANQIIQSSNYAQLLRGDYKGKEAPVQLSEWILGSIGVAFFGDSSDLSFRIWGVIFSSLSILTIWLLLRELVNKSWAIVGVAFFALSPGMIEHSQEFKPYSLDVLLTLLCFHFFLVLERTGWRRWCSYVIFLAIFALSSNCFLFLIFVIPIAYYRVRKTLRVSHFILTPVFAIPLLFYIGLYALHSLALKENKIFAFWLPYTFSSWRRTGELFTSGLPSTLGYYAFSPLRFASLPTHYSWIALFVLVVVVPAYAIWFKHWSGVFIFLPFLGQTVLSITGLFPMFQRVSCFYYPMLIVSSCILIDSIWTNFFCRMLSVKLAQNLSMLAILPIVFFQVKGGLPHKGCCMRHKTEIREIVRSLENSVRENDLLFVSPKAEMALDRYRFAPPVKISFIKQKVPTVRFQQSYNTEKVEKFIRKVMAFNTSQNIWIFCLESEANKSAEAYLKLFANTGYDFQIVDTGERAFLARVKQQNSSN